MKNSWKKLIVCGVILLGAEVFSAERPPENVLVGTVRSVPVQSSRRYIGKISAVNDVSLIARVNGVIFEQKFANGDLVEKDQLLFVLEDTTYRAALKTAEANLARSQAEYKFAVSNLKRYEDMRKTKAVSESAYDEAILREATCKAAVMAAEAALLDAQNNLSYTRIKSPIKGKAGKAAVSPGNYITPSAGELVNVVSLDDMYVNFWISMSDYMRLFGSFEELKKEAHLKIMLADGSEFTGEKEIVFIDNRVDDDTDTIRVRAKIKNDGMKLIPDALVSVFLSRKDGNKTVVPVSAVLNNGQISFVYVLDDKNCAQVRPVELGGVQGNDQIILKGLNEGEKIVVDGTHKVFPTRPVNPVPVANGGK
ncbi:MAG: efflux RND transporter periplasmic adaptor subunit [Lentisphaeria bacterium]|nr:efflux RND transporter periplasmic adaptor subunit [Lentisphaerota bacterium]MBR2626324.1 efflux RND transporter periplasmic adaptor subunit [Lentisphaeria bacterium]